MTGPEVQKESWLELLDNDLCNDIRIVVNATCFYF